MPEDQTKTGWSASSQKDRELVSRALEGDQRAYALLVQKYQKGLSLHIKRTIGETKGIEDLVQEAFMKAFNALDTYSTSYAFSTWLYKIASNHAIDYKRKRRLATTSLDKPTQTKEGEVRQQVPDTTYRPDRRIEGGQRTNIIQEAIDSLPPKYHRVIVMRHQQEKSYEEIAQELDLPLGTVKAHIFRARRLLYTRLRDKRDSL
ncbi:MAG: sigma-70 family RNA polymerase sigma factor [Rhodothermaceae bacterium]|nr:sigma-70 family RNA polymerase sigma factor [Bacteroidota bacterium]MXW14993.1 sigma-70 family RNA polymerase sigma factor [Rhodothermaceae bacterium]MXW31773.1 sigma-70 family RNA polymerase sigma factor [Rhodothermaceae bacterium]MYC05076.1 sigma-70 family RNA polymerase sigma factor [Rhodothermaceae bacterium]MYE62951.1 sigma-70 family RNA polymerase sigma factor [Rhodothermaceae bacterium]